MSSGNRMTKLGSELQIWLEAARAADPHVDSPVMSEEAVDQMLEASEGAASRPIRLELDGVRPA
jgi:hypothetical protein